MAHSIRFPRRHDKADRNGRYAVRLCITKNKNKRPPRLVTAEAAGEELPSFIRLEDETLVYEIYPEDTPMLVRIKEFMALYGLVDIRMRDAAHSGAEADYGLSGKLRTDWYAGRAEKIYRQRRRSEHGAGSLRGAGGETLRVEHRAAAVCGVKFVFFPSHINIPAGASWPGRDLL